MCTCHSRGLLRRVRCSRRSLCRAATGRRRRLPTRPITMIVPYPAGGGVDVMGRIVGQKLSVALGQQVVSRTTAAPAA